MTIGSREAYIIPYGDDELSQFEMIQKVNFSLARISDRLDALEGIRGTPTQATNPVISGLTASRLVATDSSSQLQSADLVDYVAGANVSISDDSDGTITVAIPQSVATTASPTFAGTTLTGLTASRIASTDGSKGLASVALLSDFVIGTADQITVFDGVVNSGYFDDTYWEAGSLGIWNTDRWTATALGPDYRLYLKSIGTWDNGYRPTRIKGTTANCPDGTSVLLDDDYAYLADGTVVDNAFDLEVTFAGRDLLWLSIGRSVSSSVEFDLLTIEFVEADGTITLSTPQDISTTSSPTFAALSVGTGEITAGSINRTSGTFTIEIGGTSVIDVAATGLYLVQNAQTILEQQVFS